MGLNFTDQTIGRLVSSPVGHQEIKNDDCECNA